MSENGKTEYRIECVNILIWVSITPKQIQNSDSDCKSSDFEWKWYSTSSSVDEHGHVVLDRRPANITYMLDPKSQENFELSFVNLDVQRHIYHQISHIVMTGWSIELHDVNTQGAYTKAGSQTFCMRLIAALKRDPTLAIVSPDPEITNDPNTVDPDSCRA